MGVFAELHGAAAITTKGKRTMSYSKVVFLNPKHETKLENETYSLWFLCDNISVEVIIYGWRVLKYFHEYGNTRVLDSLRCKNFSIVLCRKTPNRRNFSQYCKWRFLGGCTDNLFQLQLIQTSFILSITVCTIFNRAEFQQKFELMPSWSNKHYLL